MRRFFEAFQRGEIERMLSVVHPDAEFDPAAPVPGRTRLQGRDEIEEWARWAARQRPVMVAATHAFRVLDEDDILVCGRVRMPHMRGGYADRGVAWLVGVVDQQVRRFEARFSIDEALELHEREPRPEAR